MIEKIVHPIVLIIFRIRIIISAFKFYKYDASKYLKYSNSFKINDSENKLIGRIIAKYHVIEKGLTMPNFKYGFGNNTMISLIEDCDNYYHKYNNNNEQLLHAISVIAEYKYIHEINKKPIDNKLLSMIDNIMSLFPDINKKEQIFTTRKEYFKFSNLKFDEFSNSRHSLRNFTGKVNKETIEKAVMLAQNAPSSCNRQPIRIYIIEDKHKIKKIFNLQNGNRGFGHLVDKVIILSAELGVYCGIRERNMHYIDAGIYAMNLLYALHFYQVGACMLNWSDTPEVDKGIRTIIEIPFSEKVILLIACGGVPENFKLTLSKRYNLKYVLRG